MTIKTIFVDVGGVLLTNGWDKDLRKKAADEFSLDWNSMQERHLMVLEDYETGRLSLEEYLDHVVFFTSRKFTKDDFKEYIFSHSKPHQEMIELMKSTKARLGVKLAVLSNEGRELTQYRFEKFHFKEFIDYFIVSGFVHLRKPDLRIYQLALGLCQNKPENVIYIDDRAEYMDAAESFGLQIIHHTSYETTKKRLDAIKK